MWPEARANGECDAQPLFTAYAGDGIVRPLTFRETLEARVIDYNSKDKSDKKRLELFNVWLSPCTGVAYKKDSTKFKIIPECRELITIMQSFREAEMGIDYDSLQGKELDRTKAKYNTLLTEQEVLEHPGWLAAVRRIAWLVSRVAASPPRRR